MSDVLRKELNPFVGGEEVIALFKAAEKDSAKKIVIPSEDPDVY